MNEQQKIQLVQKGYSFFSKGDIPNLLALYTEDIEFVFPGPPDIIPYAGTHRGKEQVKQFFKRLSESIEFDQYEPKEYFAKGDQIVVLGHLQGKIKPTGQMITDDWVQVLTVRDDKVSRLQNFTDTAKSVAGFRQERTQAV